MKKIMLMLVACIMLTSVLVAETKKQVAVLEFEGGSGEDGIALADLFGSMLANKNVFTVLTRTSVEAIMAEHNFQRSGVTDDETIKRIGEMVNADYVVSGKITALGNQHFIQVQMIHVETGEILSGDYQPYIIIGLTGLQQ